MTHKSGFLSGPEPTEQEEKTEAQLIDERRPASMSASRTMFDLAEDDETPAIEQQAAKQDIIGNSNVSSKPKLEANADFEAEMKERSAREAAEREKRRKAAEAEEKRKEAEREKKIEKEIEKAQSLDPEEIEEKLKEETFKENQNKLYPDAKPFTSATEDRIWEKRTDKGGQIAVRGKLDDVTDTNLQTAIALAGIFEVLGCIFATVGYLFKNQLSIIFYIIGVAAIMAAAVLLFVNANKSKHREVPSNQKRQFVYASAIPGLTIRAIFIILVTMVPITGKLVGVVAGAAIGAAIHYGFLNRYNIWVSIRDTIVQTIVFFAFYLLIMLDSGDQFGIVWACIGLVEFFLGDRFAMLMAYRTNK